MNFLPSIIHILKKAYRNQILIDRKTMRTPLREKHTNTHTQDQRKPNLEPHKNLKTKIGRVYRLLKFLSLIYVQNIVV